MSVSIHIRSKTTKQENPPQRIKTRNYVVTMQCMQNTHLNMSNDLYFPGTQFLLNFTNMKCCGNCEFHRYEMF